MCFNRQKKTHRWGGLDIENKKDAKYFFQLLDVK